jgi:hypothetical protein
MPRFKSLTRLTLAVLALGAYHAALAAAEEGALPAQNQAFKLALGESVLETLSKEAFKCKELSAEGTFLEKSDQHGTGTITFKGCTVAGFSMNSLGDASGTILAKGLALLCLVSPKELKFGVLVEPTETVHIEVPALGELLLFKGAVIVENLSGNKGKVFEGRLKGKAGDQEGAIECEINGKKFKYTAEAGRDTKADEMISVNGQGTLTLTEEVELMDT